jgi:phosphoglycerol transferase MdoB-like AlkP superfamily enzyme
VTAIFKTSFLRAALIPLLVTLLALGIFNLTRLALTIYCGPDNVPIEFWSSIFLRGIWFDGAVLAILIAPVCAYEALLPRRWRASRIHALLRLIWLSGLIFGLLFIAAAEATFWIEFQTRFNFIAVDYLIYTDEVIDNIIESYPIYWICLGMAALSLGIVLVIRRALRTADSHTPSRAARLALAAFAIAAPTVAISSAEIEQMTGLGNTFAEELSGNGLFTFAAAMRRNELDYDRFYRTLPQTDADAILQNLNVKRMPLSAALHAPESEDLSEDAIPFSRRPLNIVLISVESLSAEYLGAYGSKENLTPNLDRIASRGLKFEQVLATGTRTVRGLEALSLGTPPIPGQAIVRRPGNEHLATLGEIFSRQNVASYFFYGGNGFFDNMNAYFDGNNYRVIDRKDIPDDAITFTNAWGVADENLFAHALKVLSEQTEKPFFAHIMTTSNHRPYTYPDGRIDIPSPGGRSGAIKYTDYAIGEFLEQAARQSWFNDTLFVIVADHCAAVAGNTKLPVAKYRIPLLFYAPHLLAPGTYAPLISQIDIAPTLVEILGKRGDDHFFGRSIFESGAPLARAFISNYQELGYLRNNTLTVLLPKRRVESYQIDPLTLAATPTAEQPELVAEAIAYYQTAARAFKQGALQVVR